MEGVKILTVTFLLTTVFTAVCGISIEGLSGTKTAGGVETLRIICRAGTADAARHNSLILSRNLSISYQNLVTVANPEGNAITTWANEAGGFETRTRATATGTMTGGSSTLTVEVPDFECSDAGIYRCSLNGLHNDFTPVQPTPSATATLSVIGRNGNLTLQITEYLEPGSFNPQTFYENSEDQTQYFKVNTVVTMECEGDISKTTTSIGSGSQNQNHIDWYRLRRGAFTWERYYPQNTQDVTTRVIGSSQNSCLQRVQSILRYNVSINDDTAFRCQTTSTLGGKSESNQKRVFADNNIGGNTEPNTGDTSDAGMIAGIVVGVLAAIVLIVLLIIFIVYRRRNSGETYTTKEETPSNGRHEPNRTAGNDKVFTVPMKDRNRETPHPPAQENPEDYTYSQVQKEKPRRHADPYTDDPPYKDDPTYNNAPIPKRGYNQNARELHYAALDISTNPPKAPQEVRAKYTPTEYTEIQFKNN